MGNVAKVFVWLQCGFFAVLLQPLFAWGGTIGVERSDPQARQKLQKLGAIFEYEKQKLVVTLSNSGFLRHRRWENWHGTPEDLLLLTRIGPVHELYIRLNPEEMGDLSVLPGIEGLKRLKIGTGDIGAEAIRNITQCAQLEDLCVSCSGLKDCDLKPLEYAKHLRELTVFSVKNTDKSLEVIASIETLEVVQFLFTPVSDTGIRQLARLPRLRAFRVTPGRVSQQGQAWLKDNLPKCEFSELTE